MATWSTASGDTTVSRELCGECGWHHGTHNPGCSVHELLRERHETKLAAQRERMGRRKRAVAEAHRRASLRAVRREDALDDLRARGAKRADEIRRRDSDSSDCWSPVPRRPSAPVQQRATGALTGVAVILVVVGFAGLLVVGSTSEPHMQPTGMSSSPAYLGDHTGWPVSGWSSPGAAAHGAREVWRLPKHTVTACRVLDRRSPDGESLYYLVELPNGRQGWVGRPWVHVDSQLSRTVDPNPLTGKW
jgi:hypothetical protein